MKHVFSPLQRLLAGNPLVGVAELMEAVVSCASLVPEVVSALVEDDDARIQLLAREISRREGLADEAKNRVRDKLPRGLFLPVDRRDLLRLLSEIDSVADCAEDVGVLLTLRRMGAPPATMQPLLEILVQRVMDTVHTSAKLVETLDPLLETSFSERNVMRARHIIDELHRREHEADKIQDQIAKVLFQHEDTMHPVAIFMWTKILNKIGDMANHAENIGDRFRLLIARGGNGR